MAGSVVLVLLASVSVWNRAQHSRTFVSVSPVLLASQVVKR
jgi:hypothetical protein